MKTITTNQIKAKGKQINFSMGSIIELLEMRGFNLVRFESLSEAIIALNYKDNSYNENCSYEIVFEALNNESLDFFITYVKDESKIVCKLSYLFDTCTFYVETRMRNREISNITNKLIGLDPVIEDQSTRMNRLGY